MLINIQILQCEILKYLRQLYTHTFDKIHNE